MSTFYRSTNPNSSDNVDNGYPIGSIWINTVTYSGYKQTESGVWVWSLENSNTVNSNFFPVLTNYSPIVYYVNSGENVTNVYYVNSGGTSGGTVDINIGQLTGYSGENFIVVNGNGTPTENGELLKSVYDKAKTMTPNGSQISESNPMNIMLSPGYYEIGEPLIYRIKLLNTNTTPINGDVSIVINCTYGRFVYSDYYEGITPNTLLSDLILYYCNRSGSTFGLYMEPNFVGENEDIVPIESGDTIYLDYHSISGYGVEKSVISISILVNGSNLYSPTIEKINKDIFSLDYDYINIKNLYPSTVVLDRFVGGGPIINFLNIKTNNVCLDGLIIGGDVYGNNNGHLRLDDKYQIYVSNCSVYAGPGSVFGEVITGSSVFCSGFYHNCILTQPGAIDSVPLDDCNYSLVVDGVFEDINCFVGFGVVSNGGCSSVSIDGTFRNCTSNLLGFGVSTEKTTSVTVNASFENCRTKDSGFGSSVSGGTVNFTGRAINCLSKLEPQSLGFTLYDFASGPNNNTIYGRIYNSIMMSSGSFNGSNVVSNGIIRQCINGDGTIVNG